MDGAAWNQWGFLNDSSLAAAFQAQRRTPASGRAPHGGTIVAPRPGGPTAPTWGGPIRTNGASDGGTPAASPWGTPTGGRQDIAASPNEVTGSTTQPSLSRRVADHLLLSPQATAATTGSVAAQQVLDRRTRQEAQEQAALMADLERLGFIQAGIAAAR